MSEETTSINQTMCRICEVNYSQTTAPCPQCGQESPRFTTAERTAIDIDLEQPVLLQIKVSVHHCEGCKRYFRVQPPFMRQDAIYSNRVVEKAVESVYEDGMATGRAAKRMQRDFWVQPTEGIIRKWSKAYRAGVKFEVDYQPWVVQEFSGILCVDEVYQDELALLVAVDPSAPEGDRLVGYQLVRGSVDGEKMEGFLAGLKEAGIEPAEVITDGSSLYPTVIKKVWEQAAHQLCLFHETRRVTRGAMKGINAIRQGIPTAPAVPSAGAVRGLRAEPPGDDPTDPAVQHWQQRQAEQQKQIGLVHHLAEQGYSQRGIERQTGFSRHTVKKWLSQAKPDLSLETILAAPAPLPAVPAPQTVKQDQIRQVHRLFGQGLSYSEIGRQVGVHRFTVKKWLQLEAPAEPETPVCLPATEEPAAKTEEPVIDNSPPPPSAPWTSWEQVKQVREALQEHRFLLLRRPENLNEEEQAQVEALLSGPLGAELQVERDFVVDWYRIWKDETGQRRSVAEAKTRYEAWQTNKTYAAVSALHRVQLRFPLAKFEQLSPFLQQPAWEATNNGAERAGRDFRHMQGPHFNLRSKEAIEQTIAVRACLRKKAITQAAGESLHTCQRGRRKQPADPPGCPPATQIMSTLPQQMSIT